MSVKKDDIVLSGYINDIKTAFLNVYGRESSIGDSEIIATTLYSILKSYYFENLYRYTKIGVNENNEYAIKMIPNKNIETSKINIDGISMGFLDFSKNVLGEQRRRFPKSEELPINSFTYTVELGLGVDNKSNFDEVFVSEDIAIDPIKLELKKINPLYVTLFEDSSLKQDVILKSKRDTEFLLINEQDFLPYLRDNILIQPNLTDDEISDMLNKNYDFRYLSPIKENRNNSFYVISKNGLEISGIASANESNLMKEEFANHKNKEYASSFLRLTSVMVGANQRGKGLGSELFGKLLNECENKSYVLIRSNLTDLGKVHLKNTNGILASKSNIPVIDDDWITQISKNIPKLFNGSLDNGINKLKKITDEIRVFYSDMNDKKMHARSADDIYDIEDAEKLYLMKLESKFNSSSDNNVKFKI